MPLFNAGSVAIFVVGAAFGLMTAGVYNYTRGGSNSMTYETYSYGMRDRASVSISKESSIDYSVPPIEAHSYSAPTRPTSPISGTNASEISATNLASFVEEYIPPTLLHKYNNAQFQFNVSRSMLRRSRPVVGNTERLHAYLRKLHAKKCTTILVIGGSVSGGHHVVKPKVNAYPPLFVEWLNERYPCSPREGTAKQHQYKSTPSSSSQSQFSAWSTVDQLESFDMVLIEFNVNDHFTSDLPHALEDKGEIGEIKEYMASWYYEVMLRRLLKIRKPDPPAIITFNADYLGRSWAGPRWFDPDKARKTLFYYNQEPMKNWVSSMYEIPVFSAVQWMLPLAGKQGLQFNKTINPYSTSAWHTDACCHPRAGGHRILNLVLAYCLVEEENVMLSNSEDDKLYVEKDFTATNEPFLRKPIYLSPDEDALYVQNNVAYSGADFTDPTSEKSWIDKIVAVEGWTFGADNVERDKFGFSTNSSSIPPGGQHIAIKLSGGRHGVVEVSYVISYENFGVALAWFDSSSKNENQQECEKAVKSHDQGHGAQKLVARWAEKASVPKADLLKEKLQEGEVKLLHICLTPRSENLAVGPENKFKLLGVRVY